VTFVTLVRSLLNGSTHWNDYGSPKRLGTRFAGCVSQLAATGSTAWILSTNRSLHPVRIE